MPSTRTGKSSREDRDNEEVEVDTSPVKHTKNKKTKADIESENAQLLAQIAKLKTDTSRLMAMTPKNKKEEPKKVTLEECPSAVKRQIKHAIKAGGLWGEVKFISDEEDEYDFAAMIYDFQGKKTSKEVRDYWIKRYSGVVCSLLNGHRSYVMTNLKNVLHALWESNDKSLPPIEDMKACATRNIDINDEASMNFFKWYWEKWVPQLSGHSANWAPEKRHYLLMSEAAPEDDPTDLYVTPENEAFGVLVYINNHESWPEHFLLKEDDDLKDKEICIAKKRPANVDAKTPYVVKNTKILCYDAKFKGKWTKSDSGSKRIGGWHWDGVEEYDNMVTEFKKARENDNVKELETKTLALIREDNGLEEGATVADKKKKRKGQKETPKLPKTWNKNKKRRTQKVASPAPSDDDEEEVGGESDKECQESDDE